MPGTASSLENHEWYTHGSCSGMAPEQFFTTADRLVTSFQQTRAGAYISAHAGQAIDTEALLAEFAKDFGDSSRSAVAFSCLKGTNKLIEVHVFLKNSPEIENGFQGALAAAGPGDQGNCPQDAQLLAPGAK
jgi:ribonuclease T2